jgi:hypothetical protein
MTTNALNLTNSSAASRVADIRAIKPPVIIPTYWYLLWIALALAAVTVAAILAWRYQRKRASQPPPPPHLPPPHERAREKLRAALALLNQPRAFCILVSDTIRVYLEERFTFHAPERTTEEFLRELQATDLLTPDQKQSLGEFLSVCDMVKFARYEPGLPELHALHDSAARLIDETEPQPEPVTAESPPGTSQPA